MSSQETTVIATFSSRRDAEIAHEFLSEEGISAFVSADDAGGMHPELQRSQGVHLLVMDGAADRALALLEEADLLTGSWEDVDAASQEDPLPEGTSWGAAWAILYVLGAALAVLLIRSLFF
jgi:hypothetical protein